MSDDVVRQFLATKDERGYVHMDIIGGGAYAMAPSGEVNVGEARLWDWDAGKAVTVPLSQAFSCPEKFPIFLMSVEDFRWLLTIMASGKLKPESIN